MNSYILGLAIFIITIIINSVLLKLNYIYLGEAALTIITMIAGVIYTKIVKSKITSKDILKTSFIVYIGFVSLKMLIYLPYVQDSIPGVLPGSLIGLFIGELISFLIVFVILTLIYSFLVPKDEEESFQIYSVMDDIFANQLIELLANNNIKAYSMKNKSFDPLVATTFQNNAISIILKNNKQYKDALALIELFFKEQSEKEAWTCPTCNENIDGNFDACWNCGFEK